jgi:hypothetical protein
MESRSDSTPAWREQPPAFQPPVLQPNALAPAAAPASAGPLTVEHMRQLSAADVRARKLRSAAGVAKFNGITIGVFGGLSLLIAAVELATGSFDWLGFVMGIGLSIVAWNEFRGRKLLQQFQMRATPLLGWNQVGLMVLIVAYAAWMLYQTATGHTDFEQAVRQQGLGGSDIIGSMSAMVKSMTELVYELLIGLTIIFQGLNSIYYFTRAKLLRGYLAETPPWVVELQRCQAGGAAGGR